MTELRAVQLVAVVGGSGAGKSWLVDRLCTLLGEKACHLRLDDFYRDRSHLSPTRRARLNFDVPSAIDWDGAERVLRECRGGRPVRAPRYDFVTHTRLADRTGWQPRPLVLVDGLWLLRPPTVRALFDLKIYLDTPTELRRTRRLARDVAERGYSPAAIEHRFRTEVIPMHDRFVAPQKKWADLVLVQPFEEPQVAQLADHLWQLLERAGLVQTWMHETLRAELSGQLLQHEYCS